MFDIEQASLLLTVFKITINHFYSMLFFYAAIVSIIMVCINYIYNYFKFSYDDSDSYETKQRSGLKVHTDYKTGLQYLSYKNTLIPRVDSNGKQININKEENK